MNSLSFTRECRVCGRIDLHTRICPECESCCPGYLEGTRQALKNVGIDLSEFPNLSALVDEEEDECPTP